MKPLSRQAGFTLLEIMLVVVLMATMAMLVVQTLPASDNDDAKEQATALYHKLQLLSDDAMLNGRDYGLRLDENEQSGKAYTFMLLGQEGWDEIPEENKFYHPVELDGGLSYEYELGGKAWEDNESLFNPGDLFEESKFEDEEEKKAKPPQIYVLSSGEITPVRIAFNESGQSGPEQWRVLIAESGLIYLLAPDEEDPELDGENK